MSLFKNNPNVNDTHTVGGQKYKWNGTTWKIVQSGLTGSLTTSTRTEFVATASQSEFTPVEYTPGYIDVYMNGIHLDSSDYTATDGLRVTMTSPVAVGTEIYVVAYSKFAIDDHYTKAEIDGKDATNASAISANTTAIGNIPPATITEVSDQTNTSTGYLDIPSGTTAQRPGSPDSGVMRFNTTTTKIEIFSNGVWLDLDTPPLISSVGYPGSTTAADPAGGETITIHGSNFSTPTVIKFRDTSTGVTTVFTGAVTLVNSTQLSITSPALPVGDYDLLVESNGVTGVFNGGYTTNALPGWTTAAGNLGSVAGGAVVSITVAASETDGGIIAYSVTSGSLPTGLSLTTNVIGGTASTVVADTTSTFTMRAIDDEGQIADRTFNIVVTSEYLIGNSLRFNDDDSAYLSRTPSSAGDARTWTLSFWVKRCNIKGVRQIIFTESVGPTYIRFDPSERFDFYVDKTSDYRLTTTAKYRDTGAWMHFVCALDTTQATPSDRMNLYVNGEKITDFSTETYPPLNHEFWVNTTSAEHRFGKYSADYLDAYLADVNFVDGQALNPTAFGEVHDIYGHWIPKSYAGTYGTNGFHLDFKTSGTLGNDANGSNNWTTNNLASTDQMIDTPNNNFCTLNPLEDSSYNTLSEGNLLTTKSGGEWTASTGTFSVGSGKWYFEYSPVSGTNHIVGVRKLGAALDTAGENNNQWGYYNNSGNKKGNSADVTYGSSWANGDVIGVELDMDNNTIDFYKNGVSQGEAFNNLSAEVNPYVEFGSACSGVLNFGQDSSFAGNVTVGTETDDNSNGSFKYDVPAGFLALCTKNLPDPAVIPSEHFNTIIYNGTSTSTSYTGVGFKPDFVWTKAYNQGYSYALFDVVRGPTRMLWSDSPATEDTNSNSWPNELISFDADGFTSGGDYHTGHSTGIYVAWNWKAGGTMVSNTDGSITSNVSANQAAGFSVVSDFTEGGTVGHGLGAAPEFMIMKSRTVADSWFMWHHSFPNTAKFDMGGRFDSGKYSNFFSSTAPNDTVITMNSGDGQTGGNLLAYCFRSIPGYSKMGGYVGNGSNTDGTFVYCGFEPKYIMLMRASTTLTGPPMIIDNERSPYNPNQIRLEAQSAGAQGSSSAYGLDMLSNGFKMYSNNGEWNQAGIDFVFMAFAEQPFKYSNAR